MSLIEEIVALGFDQERALDQGRMDDYREISKELEVLRDIYKRNNVSPSPTCDCGGSGCWVCDY